MTPIAHDNTSTGCLAHAIFSQSTLALTKFTIVDFELELCVPNALRHCPIKNIIKLGSTVKIFFSLYSNDAGALKKGGKIKSIKMELGVPEGDDAERETSPMPQAGTLDLDLIISRLLSYKDDPGKQVDNGCRCS